MSINNNVSQSTNAADLIAFIPCYDSGGNSVIAIKKDGETILINKGIKSVVNNLLKEKSINIKSLKKNFKDHIGGTNIMPLPLGLGTVLIPVKVRKTIGKNDGCHAYLDLSYIKDISENGNTTIKLKCGNIINCLESAKAVGNRMKKGKLIEEEFSSRMMGACSLKEGISCIQSEYSKLATKGDITMLAYQIMKLLSKLE